MKRRLAGLTEELQVRESFLSIRTAAIGREEK